jgi:uncharacterized protein (TIGR02996 family)
MNDGEALRQAVIANRDDDTPRLIYADWLDENGQSDQATFIRAQVEAARAEPFGVQARNAETIANRLLERHRKVWTKHLYHRHVEVLRFHRGFIEYVSVGPKSAGPEFWDSIAELFDTEPIQSLRLVRPFPVGDGWFDFTSVFELPQLEQLRTLAFSSKAGFIHDETCSLFESPHLAQVQNLSFRGSAIHPPRLVEMFKSDAFPALIGLDVAEIPNLGPGLMNAVNAGAHRSLKCLDASGVIFTSEQIQRILSSPCLKDIEELRLGFHSHNQSQGPLFELDIGWVIPWDRLVVLDLSGQSLGDDAVRAIAAREEARSLRWLGLADNHLRSDSIRYFMAANQLDLKYLDVRGNRFSPGEIGALRQRFPEALVLY